MATELSVIAVEKSTYIVTAVFKDENGDLVIPLTVTWTLTDEDGTVINEREDAVETPASTVNIVLTGDDLQFISSESGGATRVVTVKATYDSTYGSGLHLKKAATFMIEDLIAVS